MLYGDFTEENSTEILKSKFSTEISKTQFLTEILKMKFSTENSKGAVYLKCIFSHLSIKLYVGLTLDDLDRNLEKFDTFQNVPRLTFQGCNLVKNDQI